MKEQYLHAEPFDLSEAPAAYCCYDTSKNFERNDPLVAKFLDDYLNLLIASKFSICLKLDPELEPVLRKAGTSVFDKLARFSLDTPFLTALDNRMTTTLWDAILPYSCQCDDPVEAFTTDQSFREAMMVAYHTGSDFEQDLIMLFCLQQLEKNVLCMIHSEFCCLERNPVVKVALVQAGLNAIADGLSQYDTKFRPWAYFQSDVRNRMADVVHILLPKDYLGVDMTKEKSN